MSELAGTEATYVDPRVVEGYKALRVADVEYKVAEDAFEGVVPDGLVEGDAVVAASMTETMRRYGVNLARVAVTAETDRLELNNVSFEDGSAAEAAWREVYDEAGLALVLPQVFHATCVYGDAYTLTWGDAETDEVEVTFEHPRSTRVFYAPGRTRTPAWAYKQWAEGEVTRANLYFADRVEKYVTRQPTRGATGTARTFSGEELGDWLPYVDAYRTEERERLALDERGVVRTGRDGVPLTETYLDVVPDWPVVHDYGRVPVVHFRRSPNAAGYGAPVHAPGYTVGNAVSKLIAIVMRGMEFAAYPMWLMLNDPAAAGSQVDGGVAVNGGGARAAASRSRATVAGQREAARRSPTTVGVGPGRILEVFAKAVTQLSAFDPTGTMLAVSRLVSLYAVTTATPIHALTEALGFPSGVALRVAEAPLVKRVEGDQRWLSSPVAELALLAVVASTEGATFADRASIKALGRPNVDWRSAEYFDQTELLALARSRVDLGYPLEDALVATGVGQETAAEWAARAGLSELLAAVEALGDAAGPVLAGLVDGTVSPAEVRDAIEAASRRAVTAD